MQSLPDLELNLGAVPIEKLADYAAISYFLTVEATEIKGAIATETRPFLETVYHLLQLEDWQRVLRLLVWVPEAESGEEFHHALGLWGQYSSQIEIYETLRHRVNRQCDMTCLNGLAHYHDEIGDYAQAIALQRQHLALAEQEQDKASQWLAWVGIGNAQESLTQYDQAIASFENALAIATETENHQGQGICFGSLAKLYRILGDSTKAEQAARRSLRFTQAYPHQQITSLLILGKVIQTNPDCYGEAEEHFQRALALAEKLENRHSIAEGCWYLGDLYEAMGRDNEAIEILERGLEITQKIRVATTEGNILRGMGNIYCKNGHLDGGEYYFGQWLQLAKKIGDRPAQRLALEGLAGIADQRGELRQAATYEEQRLEICRELDDKAGMAAATSYLGYCYMEFGEYEKALAHLLAGLNWQRKIDDLEGIQITLANLEVLQNKLDFERQAGKGSRQ